jgi:hypothetical protein
MQLYFLNVFFWLQAVYLFSSFVVSLTGTLRSLFGCLSEAKHAAFYTLDVLFLSAFSRAVLSLSFQRGKARCFLYFERSVSFSLLPCSVVTFFSARQSTLLFIL